jgi:asparagine synthase (glutamine-hydrolysing)
MPGILGIISRNPAAEHQRMAGHMVTIMRHETFYVGGTFSEPALGVQAGWTAHEHSFAAGQPFQNEAKDISLLLAGECLDDGNGNGEAAGPARIIALYEQYGGAFVEKLNGLFSGLMIDSRQKKAILFNDRYGMERIYWHETPEAFYFASEAKSLLRVLPRLRAFDREGAAQFLGAGCPLGGRTLFQGVSLLPGGSRWTFQNGETRRQSYFSPAQWEALPKLSEPEYQGRFGAAFEKVLPRYFHSQSKIGISLTGGLDTRLIMACHPHNPQAETSYTFTGTAGKTFDDRVASAVARACGLEHQLLRLQPDFFSNFARHADRTVFVTDGASGILGSHEIYFHRQARPIAPVRLTGNFGGEVFRAISTFKPLRLAPEIFSPEFSSAIHAAVAGWSAQKMHPNTFAVFQETPLHLFGSLAAGRSQISFRTPYLDNDLVPLAYQCPDSLKKSPLPAIRLIKARNAALDRIPTDRGFISDRTDPEVFLRRAFAEVTFKLDYCSDAGLPRGWRALDPVFKPVARALGISGMHKFLKYGTWFRTSLAPYVEERLAAAAQMSQGFWNPDALRRVVHQHLSGQCDFPSEINAALALESVERQLFRELPRGLAQDTPGDAFSAFHPHAA